MAIEIEHDGNRLSVSVTEPDCFRNHPSYYAGKDTPHYPVPAIPTHVEYYHGYWGQYVALYRVLDSGDNWRHLRHLKTWK